MASQGFGYEGFYEPVGEMANAPTRRAVYPTLGMISWFD